MHSFAIESYGTKIRVESDRKSTLERARMLARRTLLDRLSEIDPDEAEHTFAIKHIGRETVLELDGETISQNASSRMIVNYFETRLRLAVGEYAKGVVFIHAGVVEYNGRAIVLPGRSNSGKTTLVSELIRSGAGYLSDEYAVFNAFGNVASFPRPLSFRDADRDGVRTNIDAGTFGRVSTEDEYPVAAILFLKYQNEGQWQPRQLGKAEAAMMMIEHTLPIRTNTRFALEVMNRVTDHARCLESVRGESEVVAPLILDLVDNEQK